MSIKGNPDAELLSVYRDYGVVRKRDREGNFNQPSEDLSNYQLVLPGDLVMNKMKTWQGSVGVSQHRGIVSPAYYVCRVDEGVYGRFLHHLLRSRPLVAEYAARSMGIRPSQWDLPWEDFLDIAVRLPEWGSQQVIAKFLDGEGHRIEKVTEALIRQVGAAERYRNAVVIGAVRELRRRPLKYGFQVIDCKHRTADYIPQGYPLISTREVKRGALVLETVDRFVNDRDYRDLREDGRDPLPGDIIYSRNASVGVAAYVDKAVEVCLGQDVVLITRRPRDCALLAYVLNFAVEEQVKRLSVGSTFSRINVPTIRSLVVPDDEAAVESTAVRTIEESFLPLAKAEQAMRAVMVTLSEYRDALITEAVTGKLDVTKVSEQQLDESAHAAMEGERPGVLSA